MTDVLPHGASSYIRMDSSDPNRVTADLDSYIKACKYGFDKDEFIRRANALIGEFNSQATRQSMSEILVECTYLERRF